MAKPKAKSPEDKQAALDQMLSMAATTNHLPRVAVGPVATPASPAPGLAPQPAPAKQKQMGETGTVAPAAETVAPAAAELPASPAPTPEAGQPAPRERAKSSAGPTPAIVGVGQVPANPASPKQVPNRAIVAQIAPSVQGVPEPAASVAVGAVELASLFIPSADKKVFTMRLTDAHYQYLLLLGTIVGNGTSPPDIVHNILAHFIDTNDARIQKAITKQLRQRQGKR